MPPTAELKFIGNTCMIDCNLNECRCATAAAANMEQSNKIIDAEIENSSDDRGVVDASIETNSSNNSIVKGQVEHLVTALRTLRWSKSKTLISNHNDETAMVLNNEKCRPIITLKEVAEHDSYDDCWIILYDRVYDVTKFLYEHPGGNDVILEHGGRDASIAFRGHSQYALKSLKLYEIGELPEKERIYRKPGLLRCDELPE